MTGRGVGSLNARAGPEVWAVGPGQGRGENLRRGALGRSRSAGEVPGPQRDDDRWGTDAEVEPNALIQNLALLKVFPGWDGL